MKDMKNLTPNAWYGSGTVEGILEEKDGKHFCFNCNKMIKFGELCQRYDAPTPFRRMTHSSYCHKICPKKEIKP